MKKLWILLLVALTIIVFVYQSTGQTLTVRSYVEQGSVNEEQIIHDVEEPLSRLVTGIIERDAQSIFSIFSDPVKARYVRDGAIYDDIDSAEKIYARGFERQDHSIERIFEFQSKEYDIITPTTVLFTGIAVSKLEESNPENRQRVIAYTILWMLESDGWKAINMHISWK